MLIHEVITKKLKKTIKPKTPDQARIATMTQAIDRARAALMAERQRQKIQKAQKQLQKKTLPI